MPTGLNAGYSNNINIMQIRVNGAHSIRVTDRAIDVDGDGEDEKVTITVTSGHAEGTPSAPGGKMRQTVTVPVGAARTIISETTETDGGIHNSYDVNEFTEGGNS